MRVWLDESSQKGNFQKVANINQSVNVSSTYQIVDIARKGPQDNIRFIVKAGYKCVEALVFQGVG